MADLNLLLIADLGDLLQGIVPCVFILIWLVSNLAGARQKAPQGRRQAMPPGGPAGKPRPARVPGLAGM